MILIYQIGVYASDRVLRAAFETEGYHRRIARAKPYLSAANKERRGRRLAGLRSMRIGLYRIG